MIKLLIRLVRKLFLIAFLIVIYYLFNHYSKTEIYSNEIKVEYLNHDFTKRFDVSLFDLNYPNDNQILIFTNSKSSNQVSKLLKIIEWSRFVNKFAILKTSQNRKFIYKNLKLTHNNSTRSYYSLFVFESIELFQSISNQTFLNELISCARKFQIGFLFLNKDLNFKIEKCSLNHLVKDFFITTKLSKDKNYYVKTENYESINRLSGKTEDTIPVVSCDSKIHVVLKNQHEKNIHFIIMNINLENLYPSLILDILLYASYGRLSLGLDRYIQIDIDDIFVGQTGLRMKPSDVEELIEFQKCLNINYFKSFKFNLGFSGYYFCSGNQIENSADELLIEKRHNFNWFDHTWSHYQPHMLNSSMLQEQLYSNFDFAQKHNLPTDSFYSVSPHHSGIYPVLNYLYNYWSKIWMIKVTSTEGYPHLRPVHLRRGFIHKNIMVLPRQTCGIFTHTNFFKDYPNGIEKLIEMIKGGEIFQTILYNRINIFMTHMTNYANDRLGIFVFKNLFKHVTDWTNIKLKYLPPLELGYEYFKLYPKESEPLWTNPCFDKRHMLIWNTTLCNKFPKLIILGPQKTGTTALSFFLNAHPQFKSNRNTQRHFEETQFFNSEYKNGIDWYLDHFEEWNLNFEKSANYFSDSKVPVRLRTLIPNVKLIVITIDPIQRAYSWYQHMKAHNDTVAIHYSFYDIINFNSNITFKENVKSLRDKCLESGNYAKYLKTWLNYFKMDQILLVDGDLLKEKPTLVMDKMQKFMNVSQYVNYTDLLRFDAKKSFFCLKKGNKKCLGSSKGRKYDKIDDLSYEYLSNYYKKSNSEFLKIVKKYSFDVPTWLNE